MTAVDSLRPSLSENSAAVGFESPHLRSIAEGRRERSEPVAPVGEAVNDNLSVLGPLRFVGERKGSLSILLDVDVVESWCEAMWRHYRGREREWSRR